MTLLVAARELAQRLVNLFLPSAGKQRPCHGGSSPAAADTPGRDFVLFHEYFHGDTGQCLGANHQTGWTALAARLIEDLAQEL